MKRTKNIWFRTKWPLTALAALSAASPAWAASLSPTGPAHPMPDLGVATVALPIAEDLASGSGALFPLMAADPQAEAARIIDTSAPTGGGDVGKPIDDISFLALAANGARVELGAARDALAQLQDPELRRVAESLVRDHDETTARLEKIAQEKQWPMPAAPRRVAPAAGASRADYDEIWIDETLSAHERLAALYGAQAEGGEDQDLRRFARDTLPTLRHHLAELRRLQK